MKILTLNTWQERGPWRERWEVIFAGLKTFRPDIVVFQEIFNPDWVQEIGRRAGYASGVYCEKESGLAIFSHYPLAGSGSRRLAAQSAREDYRRFVLFGRFKTPAGILCVFDTHLSWMLDDSGVRERQTAEIADWMAEKTGEDEALICGDFNAVAWSPEIRNLTESRGFNDVFRQINPREPGLTWTYDNVYTREGRHPMPDRRIDYIFTRPGRGLFSKPVGAHCVFTEPDLKGVFASDHYGVFAQFQV